MVRRRYLLIVAGMLCAAALGLWAVQWASGQTAPTQPADATTAEAASADPVKSNSAIAGPSADGVTYDTTPVMPFVNARGRRDDSRQIRGQGAPCQTQPADAVNYGPAVDSGALYGSIALTAKYVQDKKDAPPQSVYHFMVQKDREREGYEQLHFDINRNGDLTDDPPLAGRGDILEGTPETSYFGPFELTHDFGDGLGPRTLQLWARVRRYGGQDCSLELLPQCHQVQITLGSHRYDTKLCQQGWITGRYDGPRGGLKLSEVGSSRSEFWWGADQISQMRQVDGVWYSFSATPDGDKLTVHTYRGLTGQFVAGAGGRDLASLGLPPDLDRPTSQPSTRPRKASTRPGKSASQPASGSATAMADSQPPPIVSFNGSLMSKDRSIAIGSFGGDSHWPERVQSQELPEGDYTSAIMSLQMGRLQVSLSNNYHADGKPRGAAGATGEPTVYGIKIRKDQPFVLDLSNTPQIIWPSPARDSVLHPGQTLEAKAVLIDPVLDVMIRGMMDTSRKKKHLETQPDGRSYNYERPVSLDPTVTITDSAGTKVAGGVMPFG